MKRPGIIGISLFLLWMGYACTYHVVEPAEVILPDEPISFAADIQPIFTAKCATCHASTNPVLTEGSAYNSLIDGEYVNLDDPAASAIYLKMQDGHPGGSGSMDDTEKALLLKWIEEGAQNN